MAPVATSQTEKTAAVHLKAQVDASAVFNPFYSPPIGDDGDDTYKYAQFKVCHLEYLIHTVFNRK